jgi:uncharacterized membrane protein YGL010W
MRSLESWFAEYGESHRHPVNQRIHTICVPLIFFSILALHRAIPRMGWMAAVPEWLLNWATISLVGPLVFYFLLDRRLCLAMVAQIVAMLWGVEKLAEWEVLLPAGAVIFVVAWAGQFVGHRIEGRKPSFFKDLAFLLIGPLWVTRKLLSTPR